jgi:hypothetical protein
MNALRPARIVAVRAYGACQPVSGRWFYLIDLGGDSPREIHNPFTTATAAAAWAVVNGYQVLSGAVSGRG